MPGELHEIALEIRQQEQIRRDNEYMTCMRSEWEHLPIPEEDATKSANESR
jgi:predicted proteasome-type protease